MQHGRHRYVCVHAVTFEIYSTLNLGTPFLSLSLSPLQPPLSLPVGELVCPRPSPKAHRRKKVVSATLPPHRHGNDPTPRLELEMFTLEKELSEQKVGWGGGRFTLISM